MVSMNNFSMGLVAGFLLLTACHAKAQPGRNRDVLLGVFEGRTPCQLLASQLEENKTDECIKIKWRLTLYKDSITGAPTHYELLGLMYRRPNPAKGNWSVMQDRNGAVIYQINRAGKKPLLLMKADDNILFFVDAKKEILVGNKDFSYTLNRVAARK
jgi:hypothetical protein